ncbi:MAG: nicotinate (nicotinamide) nucleotide adenylyltransferase [Clostridia bacterium]|nr:nicotinate (nicotinamide) nucleotide adenylyltransferase [Clostridia bacterium]
MRLGIFGGTFSPPHKGHLNAAACFQRNLDLDKLLIVPAAIPPNKAGNEILPADHRLRMCELAFAGIPGCEVSDLELRRGGTSYTYLTLSELSAEGRELYLLMGSDMFLTLFTWKNPETILKLATVVAAGRLNDPADRELMEKTRKKLLAAYGGDIRLLDNPVTEVSSTFLREKIAAGADTAEWLSEPVRRYIEKEKLYDLHR